MQMNLQLVCVLKKKIISIFEAVERTVFLHNINITQAYFCVRQS